MTNPPEIARLRLIAQRIAGPGVSSAADVVRWMGALQAQNYPGALTSVALRTASGTRQAVEAALDAGEIVRSWPIRGTLHLMAAGDLPWILPLTAQRVLASAGRRRAQLGIDDAILDRAQTVVQQCLAGGHRLRRVEMLARWEEAGLSISGQRGYYLLWHLAQTGTVCFGPVRGAEQLLVLVAEWITHPRRLQGEEALGELAVRYFSSHGPATLKDFVRWTKLTVADARVGLAVARGQLGRLELDGGEYFMDPRTPDLLAAHRPDAHRTFLLPGFDEFMLGYADRTAALPAEFADRIVPGGNGMFLPTVVDDGQVVGTWKHGGRGATRTVSATPFSSFTDEASAAIRRVYAELP